MPALDAAMSTWFAPADPARTARHAASGQEARFQLIRTRSDILISDTEINFPKVIQPNILVSLTQESYNKFSPILRPGGLLLMDSKYVTIEKKVDAKHLCLPMYETVMEKIGKPIVFNICMLGALIGISQLVKPESILKVLETTIPKDFMDMNKKALDLGFQMGEAQG